MRNRLFGVVIIALVLLPVMTMGQSSQSVQSDEDTFLQQHQFDLVKVDCKHMDNYAITRVFAKPVYHCSITTKEGFADVPFWRSIVAIRAGNELAAIPRPFKDGEYPEILALIKPDFKLTNEDVAETMQRALDLVYPTAPLDKWAEKFRRSGNQWTFARGRSLGGPSSAGEFVFTTDEKGTITSVKYVRSAATTESFPEGFERRVTPARVP